MEFHCVNFFAVYERRKKAFQTVLLLSEERMLTLRLIGGVQSVNSDSHTTPRGSAIPLYRVRVRRLLEVRRKPHREVRLGFRVSKSKVLA